MTPEQALNILNKTARAALMNADNRDICVEAANVLHAAIAPKKPTPKKPKPKPTRPGRKRR